MKNRSIKFLIFTILLLITTSAEANILTQYRLHGIHGLEKQMDFELSQQEYWNNYLSNIDTTFGYIESYTNVLVCNISDSTLSLYSKNSNKDYSLINNYSAFTGKNGGDKVTEGDLKTPVGIYTLIKKISKIDSFYGPMAFVTSYPNIYDKYKGKDGHGIWLHGMPTHQQRNNFTKGCIAINNTCLKALDKDINIKKSVLIIKDRNTGKRVSKETISNLLAQLYAWRYAWIYSDIKTYLNFYDPKFIRIDGMHIKRFTSYKKRIFRKKEHKEILFSKLNIIPYPGTNNMYKISFHERYKSNSFSFSGNKILIVQLENFKMKIITEQ